MSHPAFVTEPSLVHDMEEVTSVPSAGALVPEYSTPLTVSLSKVCSVLNAFTKIWTGTWEPKVQLSLMP